MGHRRPRPGQITDPARTDGLTVTLDGRATQHQGVQILIEHRRPPAVERKRTVAWLAHALGGPSLGEQGCGFVGFLVSRFSSIHSRRILIVTRSLSFLFVRREKTFHRMRNRESPREDVQTKTEFARKGSRENGK